MVVTVDGFSLKEKPREGLSGACSRLITLVLGGTPYNIQLPARVSPPIALAVNVHPLFPRTANSLD